MSHAPPHARERLGIDVGGTFTDFVWVRDGRVQVHKIPTTPDDQSRAMGEGVRDLGVATTADVVHGTTVATNALLEYRGARTALVTTEGFADVLVIGRQNRPHLYRFHQTRPPSLVPDALRLEVRERLDKDGQVLVPLDVDHIVRLIPILREANVVSIAVVLLYAFENPMHEQHVAEVLRKALPRISITLSSQLLPEYREYERTATTVINAYTRPLVEQYMEQLDAVMDGRPLAIMQSNGGVIGAEQAGRESARLVLSGPAGGVVGAFGVARQAMRTDTPQILTFDMGGTSTDVALCPGRIPQTTESTIAGLPLRLPSTAIHTVGAGGGSIAYVDAGGVLRVGPESAGAVPGPVCYGRGGTQPTVTDANVVLGRLAPSLGDEALALDRKAAHEALAELGAPLGYTAEQAALGVLQVANAAMERALRQVSVEHGYDPRDYVLVPFGGAGPLHACSLAEVLGVRRVLIPQTPGVLSALGLLMADTVYDASHAVLTAVDELAEQDGLGKVVKQLREQVCDGLGRLVDVQFSQTLDVRYVGQSYELSVPFGERADAAAVEASAEAFHAAHAQRYGYARREAPVEVVAVRVRGQVERSADPLRFGAGTGPVAEAVRGTQPIWFSPEGPEEVTVYDRAALPADAYLTGPALLVQYDTTTLVPPGWTVTSDAHGVIWCERAAVSS
ncbi:MAG: hydantoinase/oxoprolinase family protein [Rhodothermales bacterium]